MREYSDIEQEQILRASRRQSDRSTERRAERSAHAGAKPDSVFKPDSALESRQTSEVPQGSDGNSDSEGSNDLAVLQLIVDLESESKFVSLLRMIQRRLSWF